MKSNERECVNEHASLLCNFAASHNELLTEEDNDDDDGV